MIDTDSLISTSNVWYSGGACEHLPGLHRGWREGGARNAGQLDHDTGTYLYCHMVTQIFQELYGTAGKTWLIAIQSTAYVQNNDRLGLVSFKILASGHPV